MMLTLLALLSILLIICLSWRRSKSLPLPPTPKTFLNGQSVSLSLEPWKAYAAWSRRLGPLLLLSPVGTPIVIINTAQAALSILGRASFQCRPRWAMVELLGRQKNIGFQYYGSRLRRSRKILHASLCPSSVEQYWSALLDSQSRSLVRDFFIQPENFYEDVHKNIQELIVRFAYGRKPDDHYLRLAKQVMQETNVALQPGRWIVNLVPALTWIPAWMPGAGFQRWARSAKDAFLRMTREPFDAVKADIGCANPSFVKHALQDFSHGSSDDTEDIIMCAAGSLFSAGTETLIGTILTFLVLMTKHSEVQERAYSEICSKIGRSRLPEVGDASLLTYVDCIIREVYRFHPAVPLVTHSNTVEEQYEGFRIPRKTWVMANVWAMLHDEVTYTDPGSFLPERFLQSSSFGAEDPRTFVFGFGRRRCPGSHFADALVFLVVSRVLALFEILPEKSLPSPIAFSAGLVSTLKPFRALFKSREDAEALFASLTD